MIVLINAFMPQTSKFYVWKSILIFLKSKMFLSGLKIYFKTWHVQSGTMCVYSTWSRDKIEYTYMTPLSRLHVWNRFWDRIYWSLSKNPFYSDGKTSILLNKTKLFCLGTNIFCNIPMYVHSRILDKNLDDTAIFLF